jgi:hypothetical protein
VRSRGLGVYGILIPLMNDKMITQECRRHWELSECLFGDNVPRDLGTLESRDIILVIR